MGNLSGQRELARLSLEFSFHDLDAMRWGSLWNAAAAFTFGTHRGAPGGS